ncbi:hypothetical protein [Limosilactobacillus mucosae]|uniref:hypothetical protein n=1 Tax=Limosilactobacillus mucosae TaxID=97478 RepID=UPI003D036AB6
MEQLIFYPRVIKVDDTDRIINVITLFNDERLEFTDDMIYTLKLGNQSGYIKDIALTEPSFSSQELKGLPSDMYTAELWVTNGDKTRIYPNKDKGYLGLQANVTAMVGEVLPTLTVSEIKAEIESKLKNAGSGGTAEKGEKGNDGKSAYQTWLDLGNSGTEQDFINSLKAPSAAPVKRAATSVFVDMNDLKNIVGRFDNGCWVEMRTMASWVPLYATGADGYGSVTLQAFVHDQCWCNVQSFINGFLKVSAMQKATPAQFELWKSCVVHEPYADVDQYDWSKCRITSTGSDVGEVDFAKMMFAVGLFTEQTILSLGATKKS